jgi:hypothetical protein
MDIALHLEPSFRSIAMLTGWPTSDVGPRPLMT